MSSYNGRTGYYYSYTNGNSYGNSYNQQGGSHGGGRKRGRDYDDYDSRPNQKSRRDYDSPRSHGGRGKFDGGRPFVSPTERLQKVVWNWGDAVDEAFPLDHKGLDSVKDEVTSNWSRNKDAIVDAFKTAIAEQPHKISHIAVLIACLASTPLPEQKTEGENAEEPTNDVQQGKTIGVSILNEIIKSVQSHLDNRRWRTARYNLQLIAYLAAMDKPLITPASFLVYLNAFAQMTDEPGVRTSRGDEAVRIVLDALFRFESVSETITEESKSEITRLKDVIKTYISTRGEVKSMLLVSQSKAIESQWEDPIESYLAALDSEAAAALKLPELANYISTDKFPDPITIAEVSISPELDTTDDLLPVAATDSSDEKAKTGYFGTRLYPHLFSDDSTPSTSTVDGVAIRELVRDVMEIYEVNRKEAARILMDLNKWLPEGTFKPKESKPKGEDDFMSDGPEVPHSSVVPENTFVESVISSIFSLPAAPQEPMYYYGLLSELCRLSPSTVAPPLGKTVRKLYAGLSSLAIPDDDADMDNVGSVQLDAEGCRRFAEWFSVHLSNFSFQWKWPEWEGDLDLSSTHPKIVFISRAIDLEIRLSYYDRISSTLPDAYKSSVLPASAPGPSFTYDSDEHPLQSECQELLRLFRGKATVEELDNHLEELKNTLKDKEGLEGNVEDVINDMIIQSWCSLGSRSFSHFLNALERYIKLLRNLTATPEKRQTFLTILLQFWSSDCQFFNIYLSKLLQYRVLDPIDVITFLFSSSRITPSDIGVFWDSLKMTVEKVAARVGLIEKKVTALRRKDEAEKERLRVEQEREDVEMATEESRDVTNAQNQLDIVSKEQESVLTEVLKRFNERLTSTSDEDETLWLKGWITEFCRHFSKDLEKKADSVAGLELAGFVSGKVESAKKWSRFM